jgi:hypothetical protein
MIQLRLTDDSPISAPPMPIPFPGRHEGESQRGGFGAGRFAGTDAASVTDAASIGRELDAAFDRVQRSLDDLDEQVDAFGPFPMCAWRSSPEDDGPRAA